MSPEEVAEWVTEKWIEAIREAYLCARGTALARMRGERVTSYDNRGLHVYSYLWGGIHALSALVPGLREMEPSPYEMEREAQIDASKIYRDELLKGAE